MAVGKHYPVLFSYHILIKHYKKKQFCVCVWNDIYWWLHILMIVLNMTRNIHFKKVSLNFKLVLSPWKAVAQILSKHIIDIIVASMNPFTVTSNLEKIHTLLNSLKIHLTLVNTVSSELCSSDIMAATARPLLQTPLIYPLKKPFVLFPAHYS